MNRTSVAPDVSESLEASGLRKRPSLLTSKVSIAILVVVYLAFALTFSLLTRAWEADDEVPHTQYIEYIVAHNSIPHISARNNIESHQPPLYYLVAATWQRVLGIPEFAPDFVPAHYKDPFITGRLVGRHDYTPTERRNAIRVHEIRLLSIVLGLGTVLLTYAAARLVRAGEPTALAAGLFVALLPRELVVSSAITNDALVIPLCSLALVLFLMAERFRATGRSRRRRLILLGMGLALGAAAITKLDSLPVAAVLIALVFLASVTRRLRATSHHPANQPGPTSTIPWIDVKLLIDGVVAVVGFLGVSGWWFLRNKHLYGQYLATNASENYLRPLYFLHPVPWTSFLFVNELPVTLWFSMWYLQPNLKLPTWMNAVLGTLAIISIVGAVWVLLAGRQRLLRRARIFSVLGLLGVIVGGVVAVIVVIKTVGYGDARLAYVGLSAFAIVAVVGMNRVVRGINPRSKNLAPFFWPFVLFAVDLYVITSILVPLGGL